VEAAAAQRLHLSVRENVGLEGESALEPLGEVGEQCALRLLRLDAVDLTRGFDVAEVGEARRRPARLDEQCRVRRVEAGEIADVDEIRDEQSLVEPLSQSFESLRRRHGKDRTQRYAGAEVAGFLGNLLAGGPGAAERFLRDWFGPPERNPGHVGAPG